MNPALFGAYAPLLSPRASQHTPTDSSDLGATRTIVMAIDMSLDFAALDELIQIIYQGMHKFIVISNVTTTAWTVHLALTDSEGRWWSGKWTEKEVLDAIVCRHAFNVLETADR